MYYRVDTKQVLANQSSVRQSFITGDVLVLFADKITDDDLASRDVFPMVYAKPEVEAGKVAVPTEVTMVDGQWTQQWEIRDATQEELDEMKPVVPAFVTRRQARQALLLRGLLSQVPGKLTAIEDETQRAMAQIEWEDSLEFHRNRPLVIQIGMALGLDAKSLDELFIFASTL